MRLLPGERLTLGLVFVTALCFLAGCGLKTRVGFQGGGSTAQADTLHAHLSLDFERGRFEAIEPLALELILKFPDYSKLDNVYLLAAKASYHLEAFAKAARFASEIPDKYALSPFVEEALFLLADSQRNLERYYESAVTLSKLVAMPVEPEAYNRSLAMLRELSHDKLGDAELQRLIDAYPSSPLAGEMALGMAKREFARGNYNRSYELLTDLLYEFPQHKKAPEVRQILKLSASRRDSSDGEAAFVDPHKLGVVLPQSGNRARFGRYFEQGITMALAEHNGASSHQLSLVKADSKGNPIDAVSAVRKLVVEEGVLAVIGSVFTMPSIAAAIECNGWKVPMLLPIVSEQRIDEIGPWIFQTKVSDELEVSAIARVAREDLLLERFAVLAPTSPEKRRLTEFFIREIKNRGGKIVAEQSYRKGDTDFREQLDVIRDAAPESLFIPGDAEELILLLPQVSFYDLQIQLLGLSNWNSDKLLRLSQRELEGAIFPREAYHGKDAESYDAFATRYRKEFGGDVPPVAVAGYFGARLLLATVTGGAIDRRHVREALDSELHAGANQRMQDAVSLPILKVRSGKVREYTRR